MRGAGAHEADLLAFLQRAVLDADQRDHAKVAVVPGIDHQGLQRRLGIAHRRRQAMDDGLEHVVDAQPGLGRDHQRVRGVEADDVLDLLLHLVGLGGRQVDLVQHRHDLEIGFDRLIGIGQRLRLDALGRVDQQQGTLAGAHRAADLVGEVDVAGRVDQVEDVGQSVLRLVVQPNGLGLDRDAALTLDIHRIEHLRGHLARLQPAAQLDQPVGQGRFAVVDMRDDGEIADTGKVGHWRSLNAVVPLGRVRPKPKARRAGHG